MPRHSWTGWLLLAGGIMIGCDASRSPSDFKTYDQLLTQEKTTESAPNENPSSVEQPLTAEIAAESADAPLVEPPVSAIAPVNVVDGTQAASILQVSTANPASPATAPASTGPRSIELLVPKREFKKEGKPSGLRVSYDDLDLLKILNMEPVPEDAVDHFPLWLKALNGQPVRIRGFMYPTFESTGIEQFVLARDNQICCFGRDPKVYDLIAVQLQPGRTTDYIPNRPFDVVGTFRIEMLAEGGKPMGLYWIEEGQVIDK